MSYTRTLCLPRVYLTSEDIFISALEKLWRVFGVTTSDESITGTVWERSRKIKWLVGSPNTEAEMKPLGVHLNDLWQLFYIKTAPFFI